MKALTILSALTLSALSIGSAQAGTVLSCTHLMRADGTPHPEINRPYVDIQEEHTTVTIAIRAHKGYSRTAYTLLPTGQGAWADQHGRASLSLNRSGAGTLVINGMTARCTL